MTSIATDAEAAARKGTLEDSGAVSLHAGVGVAVAVDGSGARAGKETGKVARRLWGATVVLIVVAVAVAGSVGEMEVCGRIAGIKAIVEEAVEAIRAEWRAEMTDDGRRRVWRVALNALKYQPDRFE
ncbi:hypothetical protein HK101_006281, partial [Irineochytrium annulatum]